MSGAWRLVFGLLLALAAAGPTSGGCILEKLGELPVTMEGLVPTVPAKIDGADVKLLADSGAFFSMLTPDAAARAGLHVGPTPYGMGWVGGLGGRVTVGVATAKDVTLLGYTFHGLDFLVPTRKESGHGGLDGILANNILSYADVEFDLPNGAIRLFKPVGCGATDSLAYWAGSSGASETPISPPERPSNKIILHVKVNGHDFRAILDSGAGNSFITRAAARAAGVSVDDPGVKWGGIGHGIGPEGFSTWIARFQSFSIGDETVKNAMLRIGDTDRMGEAAMLLGADFLLSHRVYVANSQRRLYFTYVGGPVFNLGQKPGAPGAPQAAADQAAAAQPPAPWAPGAGDQPTDAGGFARRAAAFDARHEYAASIADYSQALRLQPTDETSLYMRGLEHWRNKEPAAALADLTAALRLKPDDARALMRRGEIRLLQKDEIGADADFAAAARIEPDERLGAALAYERAHLFEKEIAAFDQWIAAAPKDANLAGALNGRCRARALWDKQLDLALADCNGAVQRAPGDSSFRDSRGLVYLRLGQYEKSIADYDAVLRWQPKTASSLYGRGVDELRLGRTAEGDADVAAAAALAPDLVLRAKADGIAP